MSKKGNTMKELREKYHELYEQQTNLTDSLRIGEQSTMLANVDEGKADLRLAIRHANTVIESDTCSDVAQWQEFLAELEGLKTEGFPLNAFERRLDLQEQEAEY